MKDFIEITLIWITHIFWLFILYAITGIGLGVLKAVGLSYENSVCVVYGYIVGTICCHITYRKKTKDEE